MNYRLLEKLEEFGKKNYMFNLKRESAELLGLLVKLKNPKNVLEIGMSNGYSTLWIAYSAPKAKITTIEKDEMKIRLAKENFSRIKNIEIKEGDALEVLKSLNKKFDFVFIDAAKKDYIKYIKLVKLNKKALIVADNIISHKKKVKDYVKYMRENFESFLVDIGEGLEISWKKD